MSRAHIPGPCGMDHDGDLDNTDVHTVAGDHDTVAQLLGLDVHGGRVRVTGRQWEILSDLVVWGQAMHAEGALEGLSVARSGVTDGVGTHCPAERGGDYVTDERGAA